MSQQTIQISKKNQIIELSYHTGMAIYLQSKIIEAMDNEKHGLLSFSSIKITI